MNKPMIFEKLSIWEAGEKIAEVKTDELSSCDTTCDEHVYDAVEYSINIPMETLYVDEQLLLAYAARMYSKLFTN